MNAFYCYMCKQTKTPDQFNKNRAKSNGYSDECKKCHKKRTLDWEARNPEKRRAATKRYLTKLKKEVFNAYGNTCACCGETTPEFLTIDHIDGSGNKHRQKIPSNNVYRWARNNNFPTTLQLLCFNCNCSKYFSGGCPHNN